MRGLLPRRSAEELQLMRRAGRVVAEMHARIRAAARPGVTTAALDRIGRDVLSRRDAQSNFLGYHGYPAVICASVNSIVVHGIPSEAVRLEEGDVLSIDCGAIVGGWHGDGAITMGIGEIAPEAQRLIDVTDRALAAAISQMAAGHRLGDVGAAIEATVLAAGFDILRDFCGHGIGRAMHEWPDVPNYGRPGRGPRLVAGATLAVEPMVVAGDPDVEILEDGWSVQTADGRWAAHAEHTIAVTDGGPEILTQP
jgi:methionyl aminopeptidase